MTTPFFRRHSGVLCRTVVLFTVFASTLFGPSFVAPSFAIPAIVEASRATTARDDEVALQKVTSAQRPVDIATRANDAGLYIAEQKGTVVRYDPTTRTRTTVLNLTKLTRADGERGLLGLIFHPDGRSLFVNYTDTKGGTVVARYSMRSDNTTDPNSRVVLFTLPRNKPSNHNGGGLGFGPENRLYISIGDGGFRNDPGRLALDPSSFFGKIISVNPLAQNEKSASPRIWSIGLRNPWRFEFDTDMNLWVADVGQDRWEEVSVAWAKDGSGRNANFGWSAYEGLVPLNKDQKVRNHTQPVHVYKHGDEGCSIIGGTRVRDASLGSLRDWYVYGDYCTGRLTAIKVSGQRVEKRKVIARNAGLITAVRGTSNGEIYVLALGGGIRIIRPR